MRSRVEPHALVRSADSVLADGIAQQAPVSRGLRQRCRESENDVSGRLSYPSKACHK